MIWTGFASDVFLGNREDRRQTQNLTSLAVLGNNLFSVIQGTHRCFDETAGAGNSEPWGKLRIRIDQSGKGSLG